LAAAADHIRRTGIVETSLADVMASAGLTHGGFYKHFRNKEHLVAEALSAGVPVVVTERGAWNHLASVGCGHVVAHDAQAIADALDRLLADPQAARAMGERGRVWAARTFGWDAIGQAMLREYESIAGRLEVAAS